MSAYEGYTEARKNATIKYIKEKRDRFEMTFPKGKLAEYKEKAASKGMSLSAYIVSLIDNDN